MLFHVPLGIASDRRSVETGFCSKNGSVKPSSKRQCDLDKGTFHALQRDALASCKPARSSSTVIRTDDRTNHSHTFHETSTTRNSSTPSADLAISRVWLNDKCEILLNITNSGGPIGEKELSTSSLRISTTSDKTKQAITRLITQIDPQRKLKNSGGSVTYNSELAVGNHTRSLVVVDANNKITESNETNNSTRSTLTCSRPVTGKKAKTVEIRKSDSHAHVSRPTTEPTTQPAPLPNPSWNAFGETQVDQLDKNNFKHLSPKGLAKLPATWSFRVLFVKFITGMYQGSEHLAVGIQFNHSIDRDSITPVNLRVLKEVNGTWYDAFPSSATTMIFGNNYINILFTTPVTEGNYKVHLRGTIQNMAGEFLDCDKDGHPEGGDLPPFESQVFTYQAPDRSELGTSIAEPGTTIHQIGSDRN